MFQRILANSNHALHQFHPHVKTGPNVEIALYRRLLVLGHKLSSHLAGFGKGMVNLDFLSICNVSTVHDPSFPMSSCNFQNCERRFPTDCLRAAAIYRVSLPPIISIILLRPTAFPPVRHDEAKINTANVPTYCTPTNAENVLIITKYSLTQSIPT